MSLALAVSFTQHSAVWGHDTWVQTNSNLVRHGEAVFIDLMLGNHGNEHRDFKLASKVDLARCSLEVIAPNGRRYDLKGRLVDMGYAPKEGYWSAKFVPAEPGLHIVAHTLDTLHRTTRAIKSSKTFFVSQTNLGGPAPSTEGFMRPLGHTLELVLGSHPTESLGPGKELSVRVLFRGAPLPNARVTFVPRGITLAKGFDPAFERMTDAEGCARYTPEEGNLLHVVVHHATPEEKGETFDRTHYAATMTILVPERGP